MENENRQEYFSHLKEWRAKILLWINQRYTNAVYQNYFQIIHDISRDDSRARKQIRISQWLLIGIGVPIAVFRFFFQDDCSELFNIAQFNFVYLEGFDRKFHGFFVLASFMAVYFYELAFIDNTGVTSVWLWKVIVQSDKFVFLNDQIENSYWRQSIVERFQWMAFIIWNGFQIALLIICKILKLIELHTFIRKISPSVLLLSLSKESYQFVHNWKLF